MASTGKPIKRTVIQLVAVNETGDSYYRMRWPGMEVAAQEPSWLIINLDAAALERFTWGIEADLLVVFPVADPELLPLIHARKDAGKKTLVEFNDNFYEPQRWSPLVTEWNSPLIWGTYERLIAAADGVMVTGDNLRAILQPRFPKAQFHVLENQLHEAIPAHPFSNKPSNEVVIGWGGSVGHMGDFIWSIPVLRRLLDRFPALRLHLMGHSAAKELMNVPFDRLRHQEWGTLHDYYRFWEPVHIGIVPLLDSPYNRGRSDIKALEMSAHGVVPVLPASPAYEQFLKCTGLPCWKTGADLESLLTEYIESPEKRRKDLERCYNYVSTQRLWHQHNERHHLFAACMPEACSSFMWPYESGYHEVKGTPETPTRQQRAIFKIREAAKSGQTAEALALSDAACRVNPWHPDYALLRLSVLRDAEPAELHAALNKFIETFPEDPRFLFFASSVAGDNQRSRFWQDAIALLEKLHPSAQRFFGTQALDLICAHIREEKVDLSIAEAFLTLLPDSAQLRFALAEAFEKTGVFTKALDHFVWLDERLGEFQANQKFLQSLERKYVAGLRAALEARLSGAGYKKNERT